MVKHRCGWSSRSRGGERCDVAQSGSPCGSGPKAARRREWGREKFVPQDVGGKKGGSGGKKKRYHREALDCKCSHKVVAADFGPTVDKGKPAEDVKKRKVTSCASERHRGANRHR